MARVIPIDREPPPELDAETRARLDEADAAIGDVLPPEMEDAATAAPTSTEPLRGLEHLSRVAVVGRAKLVELSERKIAYVWPPVASMGWIVMLAAPPGLGKTSTLVMLLVGRANTGKPIDVLGLPMQPAPVGRYVIFIEGEVDDIATARKLRATCAMLGVDESALDRIVVVARKSVRVGDPAWGDVERMIGAGLVSDVALDSVARVSPLTSDTNDEAAQTALFDSIARAIDAAPSPETKPVVWLVAHTRKGGTGGLAPGLLPLPGDPHRGLPTLTLSLSPRAPRPPRPARRRSPWTTPPTSRHAAPKFAAPWRRATPAAPH